MKRVIAIILNYNSEEDCDKCLSYLSKQDYENFSIVVVDNASKNENVNILKNIADKYEVNLICNRENKGFSAGNNAGLRYANKNSADWALIINPDVELRDKSYISKMIKQIEDKNDIAVAASKVLLPSGQRQNPMIEPSYLEELLWPFEIISRKIKKNRSYLAEDKTGYCKKVSGCCFFINMNYINNVGYLDDNVFLYCEEPILAKQIENSGYKEYYFKDLTAYHMHFSKQKGSSKKRLTEYRKSRRYYWINYCNYSKLKLNLLLFSDKLYNFIVVKNKK